MAQIDVSSIDGYADMSAEDKVAALEAFEFNDNSDELSKYKNAVSKANSEAAEYKRQLKDANAKVEAAEAASTEGQSESDKRIAELQDQIKAMQHDKCVADYTARLVSNGYSGDLAAKAATALADGDTDTVFDTLSEFIKDHDKALKADLAQHSIAPGKGDTNPDKKTPMTKKKLEKMTPFERMAWTSQHPDEAAELHK